MRQLASGVVVLTALHEGQAFAMTATAVCSVSAAPPSLLVCVNRKARLEQVLGPGAQFCVNILSESDVEVARDCSGRSPPHVRTVSPEWQVRSDAPPLLRRALARFDCRVSERIGKGSHVIILADVSSWAATTPGRPLLYFDRDYRNLGQS
jgi:flavin reductase